MHNVWPIFNIMLKGVNLSQMSAKCQYELPHERIKRVTKLSLVINTSSNLL